MEKFELKPKEEDIEKSESDEKPIEIKPIDPEISDEAKKRAKEEQKETKDDVDDKEGNQIESETIQPIDFRKKPEEKQE